MAERSFKFRIYTPQGLVLDTEVISVSIPGIDGEVGILPEHTQYTGVLGAGLVQFEGEKAQEKHSRLIISGGFASFQANQLVVLADGVDFEKDISKDSVEVEAKSLEERLSQLSAFDPEWDVTQQKLKRLDAIRSLH